MTARYEIKAWRKSANDKAYTVRLGSAWTDQKGVLRLAFDALPLPDEQGRVSCFLEEPRERAETAPARQEPGVQGFARQMAPGGAGRPAALDGDSIPFEMEWR
jgi:hypothetical protein